MITLNNATPAPPEDTIRYSIIKICLQILAYKGSNDKARADAAALMARLKAGG